ncbi:uncharacterized protein LOC116845890 [Odontomachus brunneus]|uniref:uncharacterized protein LOC116845890 n=1 Tax=Odontomachus brunneus TaxID=486640 RepID=UPI0013F2AAAD|nr:uncharacterized protein LOC116845890 [Odontomachus brunneus]
MICPACGRSFQYKANFEKHISLNSCLQCKLCDQKFDLLEEFNRHRWTYHKRKFQVAVSKHQVFLQDKDLQIDFLENFDLLDYNLSGSSFDSLIITGADDTKDRFQITENINLQEGLNPHAKNVHKLSRSSYDRDSFMEPLYYELMEFNNLIGSSIDFLIITGADDAKDRLQITENINMQEELNPHVKNVHELSDYFYEKVLLREMIQDISLAENSNTSVTDCPEARMSTQRSPAWNRSTLGSVLRAAYISDTRPPSKYTGG